MSKPKITINLVVRNGEKYIRHCLDAVAAQDYADVDVNILDNNSTDATREIIKKGFDSFRLIESARNLGLGGGMEYLLENHTQSKYAVALCVDVLLAPDFCSNAVRLLEAKPHIGALQAKILQYHIENGRAVRTGMIDTCGFKICSSRRLINIGHGEADSGQYDREGEIFSFEGAAPIFRLAAVRRAKIDGEIYDRDFFWYADDIDLGWRMRILGFPSYYSHRLIAFHDRQTTKRTKKNYLDFIRIRKDIPMHKRRLDWRNMKFTLLKNDSFYVLSPAVFAREAALWCYFVFFEPKMFIEAVNFMGMVPKMLRKRHKIMRAAKITPRELMHWFKDDVLFG